MPFAVISYLYFWFRGLQQQSRWSIASSCMSCVYSVIRAGTDEALLQVGHFTFCSNYSKGEWVADSIDSFDSRGRVHRRGLGVFASPLRSTMALGSAEMCELQSSQGAGGSDTRPRHDVDFGICPRRSSCRCRLRDHFLGRHHRGGRGLLPSAINVLELVRALVTLVQGLRKCAPVLLGGGVTWALREVFAALR